MVRGAMIATLALALGTGLALPVSAATTPTVTLSGGSGVYGFDASIAVKALTTAPGTVKFMAEGVVIAGCEAVATSTAAPFVATCNWVPAKAAAVVLLTAKLTPTDANAYTTADSNVLKGSVGLPVQTTANGPIQIYVDTVLATGSTGAIAPRFNGCAVMNEFLVGQKILWRVYANNSDQGNAVMDPSNTKEAYVEVAGVGKLNMVYRNHSGISFWTTTLQTGTAAGQYATLGRINYKVVMTAKDTAFMKVLSSKLVPKMENGSRVIDPLTGKTVYERVSYYRTVKVDPILKGATGTFNPEWNANSALTLFAVPTAAK